MKNYYSKLQEDLLEMEKDGLLKNPSKSFIDKLEVRINDIVKKLYKSIYKQDSLWFSRSLRKSYNHHLKNLIKTHRGISQYSLNDLKPSLRKAYENRINLNLSLIKSQNRENMFKLKQRFLSWINLQSTGGSEETLREMTRLSKNKRLGFVIKDQSNKMTSTMDEIIADHYGWIVMQWKTRNDNKVVGKPGGKYPKSGDPKMHGNHWSRRNKYYYKENLNDKIKKKLNLSKFAGDSKFKDGMPGNPIGCRCYAIFYYNLEDLPKELVKGD